MHHAQPSAKRLAIALGHWRERAGCSPSGGAISVAAAAALAHARARPDTLAYVSGHHPVVQALRRALAQDVPPPTPACRHPLPSCLSLADALSQAALRRGRTDQDLPRARAARVSELAAAIGSSPVLSDGVATIARNLSVSAICSNNKRDRYRNVSTADQKKESGKPNPDTKNTKLAPSLKSDEDITDESK